MLATDPRGARTIASRWVDARDGSSATSTSAGRASQEAISGERSAIVVGFVASFIVAVEVIRWIRLDLLLDPEPSWRLPRLLLGLFAISVTCAAGVLAGALCLLVAKSRWGRRAALPIPIRRSTLLALGGVVLLVGVLLRVFGTITLAPFWVDDISEVRPAVELRGQPSDLPPWSYPVPFRDGRWGGSVGALYLEFFHFCLKALGTTMAGVRAPSVIGGILSLFTAALLGRAFLPRGGGVLTAVILAGLRWNLIVSQWGWNAVLVTPLLDLAALSMLSARRRQKAVLALLAGVIAGLGTHVHLVAWIAAAGLGLWALWPSMRAKISQRVLLAVACAGGFVMATIPVLRDDPFGHYFSRIEGRTRPLAKVRIEDRVWWNLETAHAAITGPWWTPDLVSRHDLPGHSRLGWLVGAALAAAFLKAILAPRHELSAYLLTSAAAALLSTMAWGRGGTPNSYRYSYLATTTAVAAAAGALWLLSAIPWQRRRAASYAVMGGFAICGAIGSRDALIVWPEHPATFVGFGGQDTLVGQAVARWEPYGTVVIDPALSGNRIVIDNVRAFRLGAHGGENGPVKPLALSLRVVPPGVRPGSSERVVERVTDPWGREWGSVLATVRHQAHTSSHRVKTRHGSSRSSRQGPSMRH
jgi:hypothetical protein